MTVLAYLDQNHFGNMTNEEYGRLKALVDEGVVWLGISPIHFIETMKQPSRYRRKTLSRIAALGRGLAPGFQLAILQLEWQVHSGRLSSVRDRLATGGGSNLLWDGIVMELIQSAGANSDDATSEIIKSHVGEAFSEPAANLHKHQAMPLDNLRGSVAAGLRAMGAEPSVTAEEIPGSEEELAAAFPSIALYRCFYQHAVRLEPNDIADLAFICPTVPHFDVVAVDRAMHNQLHAMRRQVPPRVRDALFRAKIVRKVEDAISAIESAGDVQVF